MADSRINLLSSASSTASDDFFVVDGNTNGTRKLNAFSPTFGGNAAVTGNATVGGTLTVSGSSSKLTVSNSTANSLLADFASAYAGGAASPYLVVGSYSDPSTSGARIVVDTDYSNNFQAAMRLQTRNASGTLQNALTLAITRNATFAADVAISGTSASTSTSSGALVVGNGTQGGLGVGGSIYAGDNINSVNPQGQIQILGTGNTTGVKVINMLRSDGGDACSFGLTGTAYNGVFLAGGLGNNEAYIYNAAPLRVFIGTAATNRFDFTSSQFKINPTTGSTSTSSGALVVSGGVGVAGSINTDGTLRFNANSSLPGTGSLGISSTYGLNFYASTGSSYDFTVFSAAGQSILLVPTGTRNVSFSGTLTTVGNITSGAAITTSAPVGGAGLWELGLYSSTAPSATGYVTIEIGGTVYKLLASNV